MSIAGYWVACSRISHEGGDGNIFTLCFFLLNYTLAWIDHSRHSVCRNWGIFSVSLCDRVRPPILTQTLILRGLIVWNCHTLTHVTWNHDTGKSPCYWSVPPYQRVLYWCQSGSSIGWLHFLHAKSSSECWFPLEGSVMAKPSLVSTLTYKPVPLRYLILLCQNPKLMFFKKKNRHASHQIAKVSICNCAVCGGSNYWKIHCFPLSFLE